jgi:hypothetical protein
MRGMRCNWSSGRALRGLRGILFSRVREELGKKANVETVWVWELKRICTTYIYGSNCIVFLGSGVLIGRLLELYPLFCISI